MGYLKDGLGIVVTTVVFYIVKYGRCLGRFIVDGYCLL